MQVGEEQERCDAEGRQDRAADHHGGWVKAAGAVRSAAVRGDRGLAGARSTPVDHLDGSAGDQQGDTEDEVADRRVDAPLVMVIRRGRGDGCVRGEQVDHVAAGASPAVLELRSPLSSSVAASLLAEAFAPRRRVVAGTTSPADLSSAAVQPPVWAAV